MPSSESTTALAKKIFNISQLLYHLTLPKFEPGRPSAGRLRRTCFYVSLYWCRRGREGQRDLRRDSFKFTCDASGHEYAVMTRKPQKTILVVKTVSLQQNEKQEFTVLEKMMMHLPV